MSIDKDDIHIEHILECVSLIQEYTKDGKKAFFESALVRDAVLRRLQTMAESTQRLSDELKETAPQIDWRALSGFRNVLVHDYLNGIDHERVWTAIENYLSDLEIAVENFKRLKVNGNSS